MNKTMKLVQILGNRCFWKFFFGYLTPQKNERGNMALKVYIFCLEYPQKINILDKFVYKFRGEDWASLGNLILYNFLKESATYLNEELKTIRRYYFFYQFWASDECFEQ